MEYILIVGLVIFAGYLVYENKHLASNSKNDEYQKQLNQIQINHDECVLNLKLELEQTEKTLEETKEKFNRFQHTTKSHQVKYGQSAEHIIPFLEAFPHDPGTLKALFQPVDYVSFDVQNQRITFIEIKTNGAKESAKQKAIRDIIVKGNVYYEAIRLDHKGLTVKTEVNDRDKIKEA